MFSRIAMVMKKSKPRLIKSLELPICIISKILRLNGDCFFISDPEEAAEIIRQDHLIFLLGETDLKESFHFLLMAPHREI